MITIGIETSCDETAIGIIENGHKILANLVSSQIKVHREYAGVVPEIASRLHLQNINVTFKQALKEAGITQDKISLIGVTNQPGLVGCLMVGASFAKSLSMVLHKPVLTVNHLIAHLYANFLGQTIPCFPYIGLVISGGHTLLLIAKSHREYNIIGTTLDDAVGESYDKIAKLLNLGYPGGPAIDNLCRKYKGEGVPFSSGLSLDKNNKYNFSYSGLKTAVYYYIKKHPRFNMKKVIKGFQIAAIRVLFDKTINLARETGIKEIVIAGGVAANSYLRELFSNEKRFNIYIPELSLCTDNGVMTACAAYYKRQYKKGESLDFDVYSKPKGGPSGYLSKKGDGSVFFRSS